MNNHTKIILLFALLVAIHITTALSSEPREHLHDEFPSSNQPKKDERESLSRFLDYWKKHKTTKDDQQKAMKHNEEHEKAEREKAIKHKEEHEKHEKAAKKHNEEHEKETKKHNEEHEKAVKKHNEENDKETKKHSKENEKETKKHNEEHEKATKKHSEDEYNYYHNRGRRMTCDKFPRVCHVRGSPGPDCCKKKCVDVRNDELNCGMCGNKCKFPEVCCKGKCVNMLRDRKNCGRCGNKCRRGSFCEYGMCSYA